MAKIEIYSTQVCPYCVRAKDLFKRKGVEYTEIRVDQDDALRQAMMDRAGGKRSVPQIFINDQHIGGCDDLYALDQAHKLDPLLA
ncbi:MAG: glutaredoxin 3 [Gammaproteobacteria bacterium]|jgi:glutaredoxin 3|nr:glutaredoxin 3 [Gammaproteobacteria bacterium]